jgi:hypothetical protein
VVRTEHAANGLSAVRVADVNGDGIPDVEGTFTDFFPEPSNLFVMLGNGDGTFRPAILSGDTGIDFKPAIEVGDSTGDGVQDVAVTGSPGTDGGRGGLYVSLATGGTLGAPIRYNRPPGSIAVADFNLDGAAAIDANGDGKPDVLMENLGSQPAAIVPNTTP